ncbi:SprT family protein [Enterococcus villorum]|uniref:Protein SprT n=2 Tax=Enterococcus villorum TaxID=112904 RepID=A0A511IZ52_9ENTE|nr:SprT family protein [Enterococcus villorum]EOH87405.1 SprT-like family protein [Enterococcus villorum ATCC 700913]EOW77876.1 SprT-like family protein [Enterococcus villorum ATCC 700913]GEL91050.1 protein SprT [Enterococcus villorum]
MTQEELQQLVEEISLTCFSMPFKHQAVFNKRLRSTGGRYHLTDHHLDFNFKMFQEVDEATRVGIIKHELCHYHLHLLKKGYRHQDADFKALLKKTGGLRYAPAVSSQKISKIEWYQCQECETNIYRKRKIDTKRYVCGKCRGKLSWQKTVKSPNRINE